MPGAYDVLNKLKWTGRLGECQITILHRGAPGNRKTISGAKITELKKHWFMYENKEETLIPMHRVLEIKVGGKGEWRKG